VTDADADADADLDTDALAGWLTARLPGATAVRLGDFSRPRGGFSAETRLFTAHYQRGGTDDAARLVLRRETPDPPIYPVQVPGLEVEVEIQYRVMDALARSRSVPVAPLLGYEADPDALGAPFFVMGFVDGEVPIESPPYTGSGFFVDARPDERRRMIEDGLRTLARLHRIEWEAAGLGWLVPPGVRPGTAHQLDVWERYAETELAGRQHPLLERAFSWLHANLPADPAVGLCWGDPRPGNMIWQDFTCMCLTDFEAAAISVPAHDLGWWLMFDRSMHEAAGLPRLDGDPTRAEQREIYAEAAGGEPPEVTYHEVFAAARYAAIVVRVMNRSVARGLLPADQTIWLNNPAVSCLDQLLDDGDG